MSCATAYFRVRTSLGMSMQSSEFQAENQLRSVQWGTYVLIDLSLTEDRKDCCGTEVKGEESSLSWRRSRDMLKTKEMSEVSTVAVVGHVLGQHSNIVLSIFPPQPQLSDGGQVCGSLSLSSIYHCTQRSRL